MKTKCPHCSTVQNAPDEAAGREALCRSCRKKFTITPLQDPHATPVTKAPLSTPGTLPKENPSDKVRTICTLCSLAMTLPATAVGWQTTCPGCDHPFRAYIPGGSGKSSLLTCSDCHARISPRAFGYVTDDRTVLCYRCLCKGNTDLINNHMLPAMPPEKLLTQLYCDHCSKHMSFPPSALDRVITCPHCFRPIHTPTARNDWQTSMRLAIWIIAWILLVGVLGVIGSLLQSCEY